MDNPVKPLNPLLRMAVLAGVETAVRLHVRRGDDPDARDANGATPLMLASGRKKHCVVALLLSSGANPLLLDPVGMDAMAYAEKAGATECVELLRLSIRDMEEADSDAHSGVKESTQATVG